jgi:hypothetical protein
MTGCESLSAGLHPEDVPEPIRDEAKRLLSMTIATENGRTFNDRSDFAECLDFLAVLTDDPTWDFLRGG